MTGTWFANISANTARTRMEDLLMQAGLKAKSVIMATEVQRQCVELSALPGLDGQRKGDMTRSVHAVDLQPSSIVALIPDRDPAVAALDKDVGLTHLGLSARACGPRLSMPR